jgi:nitroimidazol reductase NimA-like FMN-containing flavoprotein (pyridoxamine 5'-phosphate oxidase superfamily)
MTKEEQIFRSCVRELFEGQRLAVVATSNRGRPYASLVAFAGTEDLCTVYFATPRSTRKYRYLAEETRVALLVNSSTNQPADFHRAVCVTATGRASEIAKSAHPDAVRLYLKKHPYLEDFIAAPSCALIRIEVEHYTMVKNFQDVTNLSIEHDLDADT